MASPLVLLVDDYEDARDLYVRDLTFKGYRVLLAADGTQALTEASRQRPDVILMDVRMPGLTGAEVMRRMKADASLQGVPIIAFTAHALEDERRDALLAGFDAVLPKPCLPNDLADFIDTVLAERT